MSVSIQVIDGVYGKPAAGVLVNIARVIPEGWADQAHEQTDEHGRASGLPESLAESGIYRLEFDLDRYFSSLGIEPFYSAVSMRIRIPDVDQPHHISLFITPYSCATYHTSWNSEVR